MGGLPKRIHNSSSLQLYTGIGCWNKLGSRSYLVDGKLKLESLEFIILMMLKRVYDDERCIVKGDRGQKTLATTCPKKL